MTGRNVGASVRARLLARARETRQDFSLVLTRYAIERLLYRIGVSSHADHFLLKGALLFDLWFDVPHRPTRDIDLLGFGSGELSLMESTFKEISAIAEDDGVTFDPDTVRATEIRKDANYAGVRVGLLGSIDGARCQIQVDIGFGDAVTPDPDDVEYPVMLPEFAAPKLRAYASCGPTLARTRSRSWTITEGVRRWDGLSTECAPCIRERCCVRSIWRR